MRTPDETLRQLRRAAGRIGGLTGTKSTSQAYLANLWKWGARFDDGGALVECSATDAARRKLAAQATLGRAQRQYQKAKRSMK